MTANAEVIGGRRLAATMSAAARQLADLQAVNQRVAAGLAEKARMRAPRRTGRLAASHRHTGTPQEAAVTNVAPYAGVIHYGWPARRIRPQPWLATTLQESESAAAAAYQTQAAAIVGRIRGA